MKELFDYLKNQFQDYPTLFKADGNAASQLNTIESRIVSYLKSTSKFPNGLLGPISLKMDERYSYLSSCNAHFLGTLRAPVITHTKYNVSVFKPYDIEKEQNTRYILDRCAEDILRNTMLSLLNLVRFWAIDGFKINSSVNYSFQLPKNYESGFVENLDTWLEFEHSGATKIHFFEVPGVRYGVYFPNTKMTGPTYYGDNLDAVVHGFHDIHYTFLRTLFTK